MRVSDKGKGAAIDLSIEEIFLSFQLSHMFVWSLTLCLHFLSSLLRWS